MKPWFIRRVRQKCFTIPELVAETGNEKILFFLRCLSSIYQAILFIKKNLEKKIKVHHFPQQVIVCIGNIKAGGSGKTPFVEFFYQEMKKVCTPAVISKGYLGFGVSKREVITPRDRRGCWVDPAFCGDEPFMLKKKHPELPIYVCKDRKKAIFKASEQGCDLLILDDGYQQKTLEKDINILMVDPEDPFGRAGYMPRGLLRDSPQEYQHADLLCLHYEYKQPAYLKEILVNLRKVSQKPVIAIRRFPYFLKGEVCSPIKTLTGMKIGVFCSIGSPQKFYKVLEELGARIVGKCRGLDHESIEEKELEDFSLFCKNEKAELLVCTEKDYVKLQRKYSLPISYLETRSEIIYGIKEYETLKQNLICLIEKKKKG